MWDEKKFFEDYVEESEKIKPDERFVEQLKRMAVQEEKKNKPIPMMKYAAIAASFVLCIGLGSAVWHNQSKTAEDKEQQVEFSAGVQAGKPSLEEGQQTDESDTKTEEEKEPLTDALDSIKKGAGVRDEAGNEISQSEQEELWNLLKNAEETAKPENVRKEATYFLEAEETIEVELYTDNFIQIEGAWYQ